MKLLVGLGNPGPRYEGTRHNIGFDVIRRVAARSGIELREEAHASTLGRGALGSASSADADAVLLLLPRTWMNRSGDAVGSALAAHPELDRERDVLVVFDDLDLPLGRLRLRPSGSAGGHNGLADVLRVLGTSSVPRLRFGIGRPASAEDPIGLVLGRWTPEELERVSGAIERAADAVAAFARDGIEAAMNRFNATPDPAQGVESDAESNG